MILPPKTKVKKSENEEKTFLSPRPNQFNSQRSWVPNTSSSLPNNPSSFLPSSSSSSSSSSSLPTSFSSPAKHRPLPNSFKNVHQSRERKLIDLTESPASTNKKKDHEDKEIEFNDSPVTRKTSSIEVIEPEMTDEEYAKKLQEEEYLALDGSNASHPEFFHGPFPPFYNHPQPFPHQPQYHQPQPQHHNHNQHQHRHNHNRRLNHPNQNQNHQNQNLQRNPRHSPVFGDPYTNLEQDYPHQSFETGFFPGMTFPFNVPRRMRIPDFTSFGFFPANPSHFVAPQEDDLTYEQMIQISERLGEGKSKATPKEVVRNLPKIKYKKSENGESSSCSICLEEFKEDEKLILLNCLHRFHPTCITTWLKQNKNCPVCREPVTDS